MSKGSEFTSAVLFTFITLSMLAGCGRANALTVTLAADIATAAPTIAPPPELYGVDPKRVFTKLTATDQLAVAAAQLADVLDVAPEIVRARLQPSGCMVCDQESSQDATGIAGLDVATATAALAPGDGVYLFVAQFTCYYKFDGSMITPQSCQLAPL